MEALTTVTGRIALLDAANIDTDIIFPARFLLITAKRGLGRYAFHDKHGTPQFDAALASAAQGAPILLASENFGCGSSREQAVWALGDLGLRVMIAPSFGEIFTSNCFKNGVLPLRLPETDLVALRAIAAKGGTITVDLEAQQIRPASGAVIAFDVDPGQKVALLNGWDDIGRIRALHAADIETFEAAQAAASPWLYP